MDEEVSRVKHGNRTLVHPWEKRKLRGFFFGGWGEGVGVERTAWFQAGHLSLVSIFSFSRPGLSVIE